MSPSWFPCPSPETNLSSEIQPGATALTTWLSGSSPSFVSCAFLQKSLKGAGLIMYNFQMTNQIHGRPQPGQMKTLHRNMGDVLLVNHA